MNFDDINDELNNTNLNLDISQVIFDNISSNLYQGYFFRAILKTQLKILELQKGTLPSEIDDAVDDKLSTLLDKFSEWHRIDFPQALIDLSEDK